METSDLTTAITDQDRARLADLAFEIGAVKFGAFRIKLHETQPDAPLSPIYLNFRLLRSYPEALGFVAELFLKMAAPLQFELLADIPTAITPIVAVMAYFGKFPMISPRASAKSYGMGVSIDGEYRAGQRVLLVDDVISAGDSKFDAIQKLQTAGLVVEDILVVVDRQQGGTAMLQEKGFRPHAIATIGQLLDRYRATGAIDADRYQQVVAYLGLQ